MEEEFIIQRQDELDKTDLFIIDALRKDGRVAFTHIAEQLEVSPGMIRQRYNRLVESGFLKVAAITNPLRMGLKTMAMIGIKTEGAQRLAVAENIAKFPEVVYIVVVGGRYDILAEVFCRGHDELLEFLNDRLGKIDGIREAESFMHLRIVKETYF